MPGASVVVHLGDALKAATSTDIDGKYAIVFAPNATYHVSADLTAFTLSILSKGQRSPRRETKVPLLSHAEAPPQAPDDDPVPQNPTAGWTPPS